MLHALPAAKTATQRGVGIAAGATAMGSLFMIPGVRGNLGSESVNAGAAAGLMSGYLLARGILNTGNATPGGRARMACDVGRTGPQGATPARSRPLRTEHAGTSTELSESPLQAIWQLAKAVRAELSDPLTPVMALGSAASAILGSPVDAVLVGTVLTGNSIRGPLPYGFGPKSG